MPQLREASPRGRPHLPQTERGRHPCVSAGTIGTGDRARVSQMEYKQATEGGAVYTVRMAGRQDGLAGIRAVPERASDAPAGLAGPAAGVRGGANMSGTMGQAEPAGVFGVTAGHGRSVASGGRTRSAPGHG